MIRGMILDMDGLMLDSEGLSLNAWQMAFKQAGLTCPDSVIESAIGRDVTATRKIIKDYLNISLDELLPIHAEKHKFMKKIIETDGIPIKPGLHELLDELDRQEFPRVVCTSTDRIRAENMLKKTQLFDRVDRIICSEDVKRGKPAPDIFLKGAQEMGLPPEECAVAEDSNAGAFGALEAGMKVFLVPDRLQPDPEIKNRVTLCTTLQDVADYFQDK